MVTAVWQPLCGYGGGYYRYTSWMIVGSVFVSTIIEGWKVYRVLRPKLVFQYLLPWMETFKLKRTREGEEKTNEIDAVGFYWLSMMLYPLIAGWALYSLWYASASSPLIVQMGGYFDFVCLRSGTAMPGRARP